MDHYPNNVACAFAYVISNYGLVVASDGTVAVPTYKSKADQHFYDWCKYGHVDNFGWVLFNYNFSYKKYYYYTDRLKKNTSILKMLKAVDNYWY